MPIVSDRRRRVMRAVKSKDTSPEKRVRQLLYSMGYRYRLHKKDLPGKPDIVFSKKRKVIFINGCFWHGHDCKRGSRIPKTNKDYWIKKITRNRERDIENIKRLQAMGWDVLVLWECELKDDANLRQALRSFLDA